MIGRVGESAKHFLIDTDLASGHSTIAGAVVAQAGLIVGVSGVLSCPSAVRGEPRFEHLIDAYASNGVAALANRLGQFSAAVVDVPRRQAVLVHDALGVGRCFRWRRGDRIVVASDLALLAAHVAAHHDDPLDLDLGYVAGSFLRNAPPPGRTSVTSVGQLAHGVCEVHGRAGERSTVPPWRPKDALQQMDSSQAERLLVGHLNDAHDAFADSSHPMLADVSGGLDSTTVVATALARGARVEAVTYTANRGLTGGDTKYAAGVVEHFDLPWHRINADAAPVASVRRRALPGEPGSAMHLHSVEQLTAIVESSGARAYLNGNVGDVVFGYGGLPRVHLADPILAAQPRRAIRFARGEAVNDGGRRTGLHMLRLDGPRFARAHRAHGSIVPLLYSHPPAWVGPRIVAAQDGPSRLVSGLRLRRPSSQYLWESVYEMARAELEPFQRKLDLDVLSPLYHLPLVTFLLTLPHEIRRGVVGDRQLQRRSMAGQLPVGITERLTKGSSHRLIGLQYTESDAWYHAMHDDPLLVERGWVNAREWFSEVDRVRVGAAQCGPAMIWAMETELWLRTLEEFGWPSAVDVTEPP